MNPKFLYKYRLIIVLVVIAVLMGMTKLKYRNVIWEDLKPTVTMAPSPTIASQINEEYPLWEKLPYRGIDYVVERYTEPKTLLIKISEGVDEEIINQEIYNWMRENKVATESHKLIFEEN